MIFTIQTNDDVAALDITNLLNFAHIEHTISSKQNDEAAQPRVQPTGGGLCAICGKSADHHEDHDYVAPLTATSG